MAKSSRRKKPGPIKRGGGVGGVTLRATRGPNAEGRWYWRGDVYLGGGVREGLGSGWWSTEEANREASRIHADVQARREKRAAQAEQEARRIAERDRTVEDLMTAWANIMEQEARETLDRPTGGMEEGRSALRLRRKRAPEDTAGNKKRATRAIRSERTIIVNKRTADAITRLVGRHPVADAKGAAEALEAAYLDHVRGAPAVTTLNLYLATLRRAYVWGRSNGMVQQVPEIAGYEFDPHRDTKYEKWTPNREELARLLQAVDAVAGRRRSWARPIVCLLAGTGMRVGEVAALKVGDLDLVGRTVTVLRKGGDVATLALTDDVVDAMRPLVEGRPAEETVVTARSDSRSGVPRLSHRVAKLLADAAVHAKIPHRITAHSLRRYASTLLFGAADGEYKDLMGHSKKIGDEVYRARRLDQQRAALAEAGLLPPRHDEDGSGD